MGEVTTNIRVQTADFDVGVEIAALHQGDGRVGAVATFVGIVRDLNDERDVSTMTLEHYPGMTERALEQIAQDAISRWSLLGVTIIHRVGTLQPTDQIVLVAVSSAHRQDAFDACAFMMDFLKTKAPFWKRETGDEGARWVGYRDSDGQAAERWES